MELSVACLTNVACDKSAAVTVLADMAETSPRLDSGCSEVGADAVGAL